MKKVLLLLAMLSYVGTVVPAALAAQDNEDETESSETAGAVKKGVEAIKGKAAEAEGEGEEVPDQLEDPNREVRIQIAMHADKASLQQQIARGADVNFVDKFGETPLILALRWHSDSDIVKALLELGADPYLVTRSSFGHVVASFAQQVEANGSPEIQKVWRDWQKAQAAKEAAARMVVPSVAQ
jgi:DNA-binding NarL/FixJ family response regulator